MLHKIFTNFQILVFFLTTVASTKAYWWSLASSSIKNAALSQLPDCKQLDSLSRNQRALCQKYGSMMRYVSQGAEFGIKECQNQFRQERWNCSTFDNNSVFGKVVNIASKETAFTYAISAAGVVVAVARACKTDELTMCGCSEDLRPEGLNRRWKWAGCGDNTEFAYGFAREFVDAKERDNASPKSKRERGRKEMNLHNNEAGRMVAIHSSQPTCKCHGTSGSCNLKTCWNEIPKFQKIGDELKKRYDEATEVAYVRKGKFRPRNQGGTIERKTLIYTESSPDYCVRSRRQGIRGTRGRECNATSFGSDSCSSMCCGRGFSSYSTTKVSECNCKFTWCCTVKCEMCTETITRNICS